MIDYGEKLSSSYPQSILLWNILGAANAGVKRPAQAVMCFQNAVNIAPDRAETHYNLGVALQEQDKRDEAVLVYSRALAIKPDYAEAYHNLGVVLQKQGKLDEAVSAYSRALAIKPDYAEAHYNLGAALQSQGQRDEAVLAYTRALAIRPHFAEAHNNLALALKEQGRREEAIVAYTRALEIKPDFAEAANNLGMALQEQDKLDEAISAYSRALVIRPDFAEVHNNLGNALKEQGKLDEAVSAYARALALKPDNASAHQNLGVALQDQGKLDEAVLAYTRALAIKPDLAEAYNNLGNALKEQGKLDEAISAYTRALAIDPNNADAHQNLGVVLQEQGKLDAAVSSYARALAIKPDHNGARAQKLHQQAHMCDWSAGAEFAAAADTLGIVGAAVSTFGILAAEDHPARHRQRSEHWARKKHRQRPLGLISRPAMLAKKIKIGYFSADFHDHATMYLMAGVFRQHDKRNFEIYAYSYGAHRGGEMREQLIKDVDCFTDVKDMPDAAIVALARGHGLDIAVDLKGYTANTRTRPFAYRLAPIQINCLGYPGTMGAPFIDYIMADRQVIPAAQREHYSEKVIYLPDSYQANDNTRASVARTATDRMSARRDAGLPEDGFVFCCFNNSFKITPVEFEIWMRLLHQVPGSVLWLIKGNPWAENNLRAEARKRGIDPARLVFAARVSQADHLARQCLADLFLDTFNFNAHTTASDALWAGLPVLTKPGQGFAARVAASLLNAIDLPELITQSNEDYERLALELATNPERLSALRQRLADNRQSTPLFDTGLFVRHMEAAYRAVYARYFDGLAPDDIEIESLGSPATSRAT